MGAAACHVLDECLDKAADDGEVVVCGQECFATSLCELDCVPDLAAIGSGGSSLRICGITVPLPCGAVDLAAHFLCGNPFDACPETLGPAVCGNPCIDALFAYVATKDYNRARGPSSVLPAAPGMDFPSLPCGLTLPTFCQVLVGAAPATAVAGFGTPTMKWLYGLVAGLFLDGTHAVGCAADSCDVNGAPYENGDCACFTDLPIPGVDTDGDRSLDRDDIDDDCDRLSDALELVVNKATTTPDDPFDMSPFSEVPVQVTIDLAQVDLRGYDSGTDPTDPYAAAGGFLSLTSPASQDGKWVLSDFSESNHPDDKPMPYTFPTSAVKSPWAENVFELALSDRYDDMMYRWRETTSGTFGLPLLAVKVPSIWDHDTGSEDDYIGDAALLPTDFFQLATMVNHVMGQGALNWLPVGTGNVGIHVAISASPCAVKWGQLVAQGSLAVEPSDLPRPPSPSTC